MLIKLTVSTGHVVKCFFLIVRRSVDGAGLKHITDKYCVSSCLVWYRYRTPFVTGVDVLGVGIFSRIYSNIPDNGIYH